MQFNQASDLATYPRTPEQDAEICENCGVDVLFMPKTEQMYCEDRSISLHESALSTVLCGASRPGHFDGVCLVVAKLFNLVQPTDAIFGEKDFQQLVVLRRLVRDLDFPVALHAASIVRESDGLAVSSRNVRLTPEQRAQAPRLHAALEQAADAFRKGATAGAVCRDVVGQLETLPGVRVDYVRLVHPQTLQALDDGAAGEQPAVLAAAVFFGDVRLIDNLQIIHRS